MKFWYSKYYIQAKHSLNAKVNKKTRMGALLKVEFAPDLVGFADCHPWPEFGHKDINQQLELLKANKFTAIMDRSIKLAYKDGRARSEEKSLYDSHYKIKSHYLIPDLIDFSYNHLAYINDNNFEFIKVKIGRNLLSESEYLKDLLEHLNQKIRVRIDFNNSLTAGTLTEWLEQSQDWLLSRLDFLEDPFYYAKDHWQQVKDRFGVSLALDWGADPIENQQAVDVFILKPAVHDPLEVARAIKNPHARFVMTHLMDHPLGQMSAYAQAQRLLRKGETRLSISGLQCYDVYEENPYAQEIVNKGSMIIPPKGFGLGFDELLDKENWKPLR